MQRTEGLANGLSIKPESPPLRHDNGILLVGDTRVALDTIVAAFQNGDTPEEIAQNYDALSLSEIYQTIGYYLAHQASLDAYLARRSEERAALRQEVEAQYDPTGIRARLLARRKQTS
jgi:uncharacterized protein (DUF433 family)